MEITLTIAGKETRFKKTGGTMKRYKSRFGREWFADLDWIARMQRKVSETAKAGGLDVEDIAEDAPKKKRGKKGAKEESGKQLSEQQLFAVSAAIAQYDSDPFYDMLYEMAKEADPDIPDTVDEWLDTFDDFPFLDVWMQISPMLSREMSVDAKNASAAADNLTEG